MGRLPGFSTSSETKEAISASMRVRMAMKFPVENRRCAKSPMRKGPAPHPPEQRAASLERKYQRERMKRKLSWYTQFRIAA